MKPALFNVLCEIKEKTGRTETLTFQPFLWPIDSLNQQSGTHYLNIKIAEWKYSQDSPWAPVGRPGPCFLQEGRQVSRTVVMRPAASFPSLCSQRLRPWGGPRGSEGKFVEPCAFGGKM